MSTKSYWEEIYGTRKPSEVSWYQAHATKSLQLIEDTGLGRAARLIDVGGGTSTLVGDLLARGYEHLTVLDISPGALRNTRERLGNHQDAVVWIEGDVTRASLAPGAYDIWHDRAVFHFLTAPSERHLYVDKAKFALREGGFLIMATFAPESPPKCSGLEVVRYSLDSLRREMGESFDLVRADTDRHTTPTGKIQQFTYATFKLH